MTFTPGQRAALQTLADQGPMGEAKWRRAAGARFQTWALAHHGLAELAMLNKPADPGEAPVWGWRITATGRAALERAAA
jgi:hypothetical protein